MAGWCRAPAVRCCRRARRWGLYCCRPPALRSVATRSGGRNTQRARGVRQVAYQHKQQSNTHYTVYELVSDTDGQASVPLQLYVPVVCRCAPPSSRLLPSLLYLPARCPTCAPLSVSPPRPHSDVLSRAAPAALRCLPLPCPPACRLPRVSPPCSPCAPAGWAARRWGSACGPPRWRKGWRARSVASLADCPPPPPQQPQQPPTPGRPPSPPRRTMRQSAPSPAAACRAVSGRGSV